MSLNKVDEHLDEITALLIFAQGWMEEIDEGSAWTQVMAHLDTAYDHAVRALAALRDIEAGLALEEE